MAISGQTLTLLKSRDGRARCWSDPTVDFAIIIAHARQSLLQLLGFGE